MEVTLINHSSLLFKLHNNKYTFLTDFWNLTPAFGSWLPSALPFYNPTYLAGLSYKPNFFLVISHAHDDHIDDYFLNKYFNKDMKIIINKFPSPSLAKRVKQMGFENVILIDKEKNLKEFQVMSVVDERLSNDDSSLVFRDKKFCVHHGNDNWFKLRKDNLKRVKNFSKNRILLYAAQTNSASGHPITYPNLKDRQKLLKDKVKNMLLTGFENTKNLNADYFLPYAGYSKAYVKGKKYQEEAFDPTYENLLSLLKKTDKVTNKKKLVNIFPGGTLNLKNGKVSYPFNYDPDDIIKITDKYMHGEKVIEKCDTFNDNFKLELDRPEYVKDYLKEFNSFVNQYLERFPKFYPEVIGKKLRFTIVNKNNEKIISSMEIGSGTICDNKTLVNKEFIIPSNLFRAVVEKKIVFENLYTGYEAEINRHPINEYNRGILIFLDMFGYKYKKSISTNKAH